ncbi:MAG: hypothetical protein PHH87_12205, partial [Desulfuromonas sp.]|nr:hypothetical protein [Desulfuromonas sp.]
MPIRDQELSALAMTLSRDSGSEISVGEKLLDIHLPGLACTGDSQALAQKLVELLCKYREENQKDKKGGENQRGEGQSQPEQGSEQGSEQSTAVSPDPALAQQPQQQGPSSSSPSPLTPQQIDTMLRQGSSGYGDLSQLITQEMNIICQTIHEDILHSIPEAPDVGKVNPSLRCRLDEVEALSACSKMRARLLTLLQGYKQQTCTYGSSGRKLDANRLIRLGVGDARIFKRKSEQQALNTAVMVLLDNSGRMCDQVNAQHKRYQIANPAAFALHHALFGMAGVKVSTAMFCRSSSIKEPVNIVCGFGSKPDSRAFNLHPMGGTPTHKALWYARAALLQQPESWKIILILTDGYPSSRPQCEIATKRCIKDGIEIAALGI